MTRTTGQWKAFTSSTQMAEDGTTVASLKYHGQDNWFIVSDAENHGSAEANAKLLAAAPELLKALQSTVSELYNLYQFYINEADSFNVGSVERRMNTTNAKEVEAKIAAVEAVIKKATP